MPTKMITACDAYSRHLKEMAEKHNVYQKSIEDVNAKKSVVDKSKKIFEKKSLQCHQTAFNYAQSVGFLSLT